MEAALPHLKALREQSGWSAHLGVLEEREVLYVLRIPARRGLVSVVRTGTRLPAHATSMGRVLLAGLSEAAVAALYRDVELINPASPGPGNLSSLLRRRRLDRQQDAIVQNGGFEAGVASIAVAVRDRGRVVAINISTADAAMRSAEAMADAAQWVGRAAAACSGALTAARDAAAVRQA